MAISNITVELRKENGDGYTTLKNAITNSKIKEITKRDAVYLLNKQFEGISETRGNLFIYMFYYGCVSHLYTDGREKWYTRVRANDIGRGGVPATESTAWCACYTTFVLQMAGITEKGDWNANNLSNRLGLTVIDDFDQAKSMDIIHLPSHVAFAVKEDSDKPNGYNSVLHNFGGNQGDGVGLNATNRKRVTSFGTSPLYDEKISAGDFLSILAYFRGANLMESKDRIKEINCRLNPKISVGTPLETEVRKVRTIIGESDSTISSGYYLGTTETTLRKRMKELIIFEQSLINSGLPITKNISESQTASSSNTR